MAFMADSANDKPEQYFEGVLQLRECNDKLIRFVESTIKKDNKARIAKIEKKHNGYDYYLSSQRYLRALGKKIKAEFPGQLIHTRKLFTRNRQTSKNVYRVFVMFRHYNIKKGAELDYRGDKVKVVSIGNKITAKTKQGKKIFIDFSEVKVE